VRDREQDRNGEGAQRAPSPSPDDKQKKTAGRPPRATSAQDRLRRDPGRQQRG
jgi:hypothetical protein